MKTFRTVYDPVNDRWVVTSWLVLLPAQMDAIKEYVLRTQQQRYASMPPGDRRDIVGLSIKALQLGRIIRMAVAKPLEQEVTLMGAT